MRFPVVRGAAVVDSARRASKKSPPRHPRLAKLISRSTDSNAIEQCGHGNLSMWLVCIMLTREVAVQSDFTE
jgi:hypothetical protein